MKKVLILTLIFGLLLVPQIINAQECGIKFLTSLYVKRIIEGTKTTQSFTLKNTCNETISLKEYNIAGTVLTPTGEEKPIGISELNLLDLPAKGETKVIVDIDTEGISSGKYSPSITIIGDYKGNLVTATLGFEITVVGSVAPPGAVEVNLPTNVFTNTEFSINVSGMPSGATVSMIHSHPELNQTSEPVSTMTEWIWHGKISKVGTYSLSILISTAGGIDFKGPYSINAKEEVVPSKYITMSMHPSDPEDGDTIILTALDSETNKTVSECDYFINSIKTSTMKVEAKEEYDIRIECNGRETYTESIDIPALECEIVVSPENAYENDKIAITSIGDGATLSGTIKVNGVVQVGEYTAIEGNHTLDFDNEKYTCSAKLNIDKKELKMESTIPDGVETGTDLTFMFNRETEWKIKNENNVTVKKDESNRIDFSADNSGEFTIWAEDKNFGTFNVSTDFLKANWIYLVVMGFVVFIIVVIVLKKVKGRGKTKATSVFEQTGPGPKFGYQD